MRGWMRTKLGLALVVMTCMTLSSCLVGNSKAKTYKVTSSALPAYTHGDYILMQYESYMVGSSPQSTSTGITMTWEDSILPLPFSLGPRSALRFVFQELNASAVQYITQDADGSIFLNAFEGIGSNTPGSQTHTYWPNKSVSLAANNPPSPVQVFWSPLDPGRGIDRTIGGALDYNIVGECDSSVCNSIGSMEASDSGAGFKITDAPGNALQLVTTPLGNFETYNIHYAGTLTVTNPYSFKPTVAFDHRASCLAPGQNGTASFEGEMWIYPPIGPVKIRNFCLPSTGPTITYTAQITGTNIPFR